MKSSEILDRITDNNTSVLVVGDISNWDLALPHLLDAHTEIRENVSQMEIRYTPKEAVLRYPRYDEYMSINSQDLSHLKQRLQVVLNERCAWQPAAMVSNSTQLSYHVRMKDLDGLLERYDLDLVVSFLQGLEAASWTFPGFMFFLLPYHSGNAIVRNLASDTVSPLVEFRDPVGTLEYRWYTENADKPTDWHRVEDST